MWSVLPTWAYPPSDPLHTPYYTLYIGFCQIKKNFLDKCVFWVYNRISPPGLIYNIYRCRQLIPSDILWGFFYVQYKGRQNQLRLILNQLKKNKNLSSVYTQVCIGGSDPCNPLILLVFLCVRIIYIQQIFHNGGILGGNLGHFQGVFWVYIWGRHLFPTIFLYMCAIQSILADKLESSVYIFGGVSVGGGRVLLNISERVYQSISEYKQQDTY